MFVVEVHSVHGSGNSADKLIVKATGTLIGFKVKCLLSSQNFILNLNWIQVNLPFGTFKMASASCVAS